MAKKLRPRSRVTLCHERVRDKFKGVDIVLTPTGNAVYKGLHLCGLLWECPLCASLITTRRRAELLAATEMWRKSGGRLYHLVLTIPHHAGDRLATLLPAFSEARRRMFNRKQWKKLSSSLGIEYSVTCKEVTYGSNGWHVHTHQLLFVKSQNLFDCDEVGDQVFEQWRSACVAVGLPEPTRRGVDLQAGSAAAAYASKWGVEDELTRSHLKRGRAGHYTPWDLLRLHDESGEPMWGALYNEFADAFSGSRQLVWSDGLRDWAGLGCERTDSQLANDEEDLCKRLGTIPYGVWLRVIQTRAQCELLEIAASSGWTAVLDFLLCLMDGFSPPKESEGSPLDWRAWLASDN